MNRRSFMTAAAGAMVAAPVAAQASPDAAQMLHDIVAELRDGNGDRLHAVAMERERIAKRLEWAARVWESPNAVWIEHRGLPKAEA